MDTDGSAHLGLGALVILAAEPCHVFDLQWNTQEPAGTSMNMGRGALRSRQPWAAAFICAR